MLDESVVSSSLLFVVLVASLVLLLSVVGVEPKALLEPNAGALVPDPNKPLLLLPNPLPDTEPNPPTDEPVAGTPNENDEVVVVPVPSSFLLVDGAPKEKEFELLPPPKLKLLIVCSMKIYSVKYIARLVFVLSFILASYDYNRNFSTHIFPKCVSSVFVVVVPGGSDGIV